MGPERAVDYLTEAVEAYAAVVKGWPKADMRFVPLPARWFEEGRYSDDRAAWDLPRQQGRRSARDVEV